MTMIKLGNFRESQTTIADLLWHTFNSQALALVICR